ncbi:Myo-inositol 2-dehydrogenase [subsurface metagenome]
MQKKLRAGIIGLGVGQEHIKGYLSHPQCEVKAICDFDEECLNYVANRFSIPEKTTNPDEILNHSEIDVVSICSYDSYHATQVIQALENRKHVMVEKPVCLNKKEAEKIIMLLRKTGTKLTSNLILRKSPRFINLKDKINKDLFGKIFYVEGDYIYGKSYKITHGWRGKIDFYCGVFSGGVHVIDLLWWLVDSDVEEVFSYGNRICTENTAFKFEDCIVSILKFKNGCIGKTLTTLCCVQPHFHALKIYGTKSTFINNYQDADWYKTAEHKDRISINDDYPGVEKAALIPDFIDSILNNKKPYVSEQDVFKTMSVCFATYESLISGHPTKVEYLL